jgi:hypothetical protein
MKKHLFICYNKIHYLQFIHFKNTTADLVYSFAPAGMSAEVALCYDRETLSPGSFHSCVKNTDLMDLIQWCVREKITDVYITCLHFPFSNLLAGTLSSLVDINFHMFYDGWQNIIPERLNYKEKVLDYVKFILARFYKYDYIIRSKYLAGFDKSIFLDQYMCTSDYLRKQRILNFEPQGKVKENVIYYICQYNHVIADDYTPFFNQTIETLKIEFPSYEIVLLLRPGVAPDIFKGFNVYTRAEFQTAEEICAVDNPEIIVSQASSTVFNLVMFGRPHKLLSVGLERYCEIFEPQNLEFYRKFYHENRISCLKLLDE